jgi:NhaA family Na+:H+ antiporter
VVTLLAMSKLGARAGWAYLLPAVCIWAGLWKAGIHPALAGAVVGLAIPTQVRLRNGTWIEPAERWTEALHPLVAFGVMPLFALANAGVSMHAVAVSGDAGAVVLAVVAGLALGKPIGIVGFGWAAVRLKLAELPRALTWSHIAVLGIAGGVGFTMALFVAQLGFGGGALLEAAKLGILVGSALAGGGALLAGRILLPRPVLSRPNIAGGRR